MSILSKPITRTMLVAVVALVVIIDLFVNVPSYNDLVKAIMTWGVIIAGFTVLLGATNIGLLHFRHISRKTKGQWYLSIWTIFLMVLVFVLGLFNQNSTVNQVYSIIVTNIFGSMSAAAFAIIGFYFATCLFRSFRGRSTYVILFLISGLFIIMMNAPVFDVALPGIRVVGEWIINVPTTGGLRGIGLGTAIGVIAAGLRAMLGYERSTVGGSIGG